MSFGNQNMKKFGYARVSTKDQNPDLQTDELKKAECDEIFTDYASGGKAERPQLDAMLSKLHIPVNSRHNSEI